MANYAEDILESFSLFIKDNFLCDTVLMIGTHQLKAHSVILAAASPFFKAIFKEYDKPEMHYIRLPNMEPKIMQVILDYIYSGQLIISSTNKDIPEISQPLVEALSLFGIDIEKIVIIEDDTVNMESENKCPEEEKQTDAVDIKQEPETETNTASSEEAEVTTTYACPQCQQSFPDLHQLDLHFATHVTNSESLEMIEHCALCDEPTNSKLEMQQHLLYVHNLTRRPSAATGECHLCVQCGKTFSKEASLNTHIAREHNPPANQRNLVLTKTNGCAYCGKLYSSRTSMKLHMMMAHATRKPFECAECGRGYVFKSQLISHTRLHTGEKPFSCQVCSKSFAAMLNLVQHTRIHTGERPYECSYCGNRFSQRSHLQTHLRVHTGEKPFTCELCSKSYKNRLDLRIHCLRVHQISIKLRNNPSTQLNKI